MPNLTALQQYTALVDELVCARLLAMNVAHYEMKYGALPLEEQLAMETMAGVLGSVIQGLDEKIEH